MKEIQCLSQHTHQNHPLAAEHRRVEWLENLNNTYLNALIAVGVVAAVATGALMAFVSAAGMM